MSDPYNTQPGELPRGIRNKNPGNIRHSAAFTWRGELPPDADNFCRFSDPAMGLRALIIIFHNYQEIHHLRSIQDMIGRWAPNTENDTTDYARYVAARCRVAPSDPFTFFTNWREFTRAVVAYENGQDPYTDAMYTDAFLQSTTR